MNGVPQLQRLVQPLKLPIAGRVPRWPVLAAGLLVGGLAGFNPLLSVAVAVMMLVLAVVRTRPILIVYGLTLAEPLTGGLARGAVVPVLRIGQAAVVVAVVLFALARPSRLGKFRLTSIDGAFALFMVTQSVFPLLALYYRGEGLNINDTNNIYGVSPLQTLLGPFQYYILYRIVVATVSSLRHIKRVLELSFLASILVSVIGILEVVFAPFKAFIETYYPPVESATDTWSYAITDANTRLASTLQHYSGLGAYLAFTIVVALACYTLQQRLKIAPLLLALTVLLDSVALVLTGTFAAWIGLAVGVAAVFLLSGRVPRIAYVVLAAVVAASLLFGSFLGTRLDQELGAGAAQGLIPQSFAFRIDLWLTIFLPAAGQHLLFGAGPDPAALAAWSTEESWYLHVLLRGGVVFLLGYLSLIGAALAVCWRHIKNKGGGALRPVAIATLVILVIINIMNVVGDYFTYAGGIESLWTLLALVVAGGQLKVNDLAS